MADDSDITATTREEAPSGRSAVGDGREEAPPAGRVLVRFAGEIATKSRGTRSHFQGRLARNLRDAFEAEGIDASLEERWSRFFVESGDETVADVLPRVFGISSFSRIEGECPAELSRIVETGRRLYAERVKGRTYAVRARRSGDHSFGSRDVMRELGAALNPGAEVDLDDPDVTVRVEVRDDRAYLFSGRTDGPGGLPLGVQDRAVALVSGGFDSAVAAWMALRRGVELDYLFCNLGGAAYKRMVLEVTKVLADRWSYGSRPRMHVVDFGKLVGAMRREVSPSYLQVVLKRLMYRAGARLAGEVGADAVVTGESVGQVSSQTLPNLRAIEAAVEIPILRPLAGLDKQEIIDHARRLGTYELSAHVREYCALVPDSPVTAGDAERAAREEGALDSGLLDDAIEGREVLELRRLSRSELVSSNLFVSRIPPDAVVIDARRAAEFRRWHWPGAERHGFDELFRSFDELPRDRTYVLYCEEGLKTAHLAERMQARGYEAYSFRGGTDALRRQAAAAAGTENGEPGGGGG